MTKIYTPRPSLHQMIIDLRTVLANMTPELFLISLIIVSGAIYLFNKEKAALFVAISAGIYLLPFLISGHLF